MKCPICGKEVELQKRQKGMDEDGNPVLVRYAVCHDCKKKWKLKKQEPKKETVDEALQEDFALLSREDFGLPPKEEQPSSDKKDMPADRSGGTVPEKSDETAQEEEIAQQEETAKDDKKKKKKRGRKIVKWILLILVLLVAVAAGIFFYLRLSGEKELKKTANTVGISFEDEEGLVYRNGKKYRYNEDMISLLFMGVDTEEQLIEEQENAGNNGQADSIFLMTMDPKSKKIHLIGISRDTMTEISSYDYHGNYVGKTENHLAIAYAYGRSGKEGGELMMEAVSNLFYGLPVHGFCAVNLNTIARINDAVGGVSVVLPKDMKLDGELYSEGQSVDLEGVMAENFVRQRDTEAEGSNNERMARQKQYAVAFFSAAKQALKQDITLPMTLYNELAKEMVTSLTVDQVVYLATEAAGMNLNLDEIQMLEGTTRQGEVYEEFYVDEDSLEDLIVDVFYVEVK